mgnify:CR=1 FL=1
MIADPVGDDLFGQQEDQQEQQEGFGQARAGDLFSGVLQRSRRLVAEIDPCERLGQADRLDDVQIALPRIDVDGQPPRLPEENYYGWLVNDRLDELKAMF